MSDLRRYEPCLAETNMGGITADTEESPTGGFVKAEEAEARIKELEATEARRADQREWARLRIRHLEARLRAADELADLVHTHLHIEEGDRTDSQLRKALTAYREASK
jgi:hypothetical protein